MRPKQILPGQILMSTRRTLGRRMLLTPNRLVTQAFGYFLAVAANDAGVGIWSGVAMGTHPHLGLIDSPNAGPDVRVGSRDDFFRELHGKFARWRNATLGLPGMLWDEDRTHELLLADEDAIEARVLYMLLNPQRAGICRHNWEYKGFMIRPKDWEKTLVFARPPGIFEGPSWPEEVELYVHRPPIRAELSTDELRAHIKERIVEESRQVHAERVAQGRPDYIGSKAARRRRPTSTPRTPREPRGQVKPWFATRNAVLREKIEKARASWLASYSAARIRLRDGEETIFPAGSVRLPRLFHLELSPIKPDEPTLLPQPP